MLKKFINGLLWCIFIVTTITHATEYNEFNEITELDGFSLYNVTTNDLKNGQLRLADDQVGDAQITTEDNNNKDQILFKDAFDYPEGTEIDTVYADIWSGRYDDRVDAVVEKGRAVLGNWATLGVKQQFINQRDTWTRVSIDLYDKSSVSYTMATETGSYGINVNFDGVSQVRYIAGNRGYLPQAGTHQFTVTPDADQHIRVEIYLKDKSSRLQVIDTLGRQTTPDFSKHYGDIEFSLELGYHGAYDNVEIAYLAGQPPTDSQIRPPVLVTKTLAEAVVKQPYMLHPEDWMMDQGVFELQQIRADGGTAPLHYEIIKNSLPQGIQMQVKETSVSDDGSGTRFVAVLEGTPVQVGRYPFTMQVKDATGKTAEQDYLLRVMSDQPVTIDFRDDFAGENSSAINNIEGSMWHSTVPNVGAFATYEEGKAVLKKSSSLQLNEHPRNDERQWLHVGMKLYAPRYPVDWSPYSGFSLACASATTFGIDAKFDGTSLVKTASNNWGYAPQRFDEDFNVTPFTDGAVRVDMYLKGRQSRLFITDANGLQSTAQNDNSRLEGICENHDYIFQLAGGGVYDDVIVETVASLPEHYNQLTLTSKALLTSWQGIRYSEQLQATQGKLPYSWQVTGLPNGLVMNSTGQISGIATEVGEFIVNVTVKDALNKQDSWQTTLKVNANKQANLLFSDHFDMPTTLNGQELMQRDPTRWHAHPDYALKYRDGKLEISGHKQGSVVPTFLNNGVKPLRFSWQMNKSRVSVTRKDTCWGMTMEYDSIQHIKVTWGDMCYAPLMKQQDFLLKSNREVIEVAIEVKGQTMALEIRDSQATYQRVVEITSRDITGYEMGIGFRDNTPYGVGQYTSYQSGNTLIDNVEVHGGIWSIAEQPSALRRKEKLGKLLFFDPILSRDDNRACSSCHHADKGFADGLVGSAKLNGEGNIARNTPGLTNVALLGAFFHDGRAPSVVEQALETIQNPDEMDQDLDELVKELYAIDGYQQQFASLWDDGIKAQYIGEALEAYIHTLLEMRTEFDEDLYVQGKMSQQADQGKILFNGKAQCTTCHFTEPVNQIGELVYSTPRFEVTGTPAIDNPEALSPDIGRMKVTTKTIDKGAFRVPPLRDLTHTAPYMHNGVFNTLEEVVTFYNDGGGAGQGLNVPNQSEFVKPLDLTKEEQAQLVAFLKAMSPETPNHHTTPQAVPSGLPVGGIFGEKDSDNDGVVDSKDAFPLDSSETLDSDHDGIGNNADLDDDNDKMPDSWEIKQGFNPLDSSDAEKDPDNDGFTNIEEYQAGTNPLKPNINNINNNIIYIINHYLLF